MRRSAAAVGSAAFFVLAPGVVAGLVPWLITRWQVAWADIAIRDHPDECRCGAARSRGRGAGPRICPFRC